jgi:hypothetical protein
MIGKLRGVIDAYGDDFVVIDVHGVGYVVHCSARTLQSLPPQGEAATISIETHVREQEIKLFGFTNDLDREWFRILQSVQGVGAKRGAGNSVHAETCRTRKRDCAWRQDGRRRARRASGRSSPRASLPS